MPNNRHRAIKRYTRSRFVRRMRSAARRAFMSEIMHGESFMLIDKLAGNVSDIEPGAVVMLAPPPSPSKVVSALAGEKIKPGMLLIVDDKDSAREVAFEKVARLARKRIEESIEDQTRRVFYGLDK